MYEMCDIVMTYCPEKPRYLMGVDTPSNLLATFFGIDMFDCVMPTRNARNGLLYTMQGSINIKNKKWEQDFSPIDENGTSQVDNAYRSIFTSFNDVK